MYSETSRYAAARSTRAAHSSAETLPFNEGTFSEIEVMTASRMAVLAER